MDVVKRKSKPKLKKRNSGNKKIKISSHEVSNNYDKNKSNLSQVLKELCYYKKNKKNVNLLQEIKKITVNFINDLNDDLTKYLNDENSKFKDIYSKSIKLVKNCKILGSFKNNMYLNSNLNIDLGIEYSLDVDLGKKAKYKNFHIYHNMYVNLIKMLFYKKKFVNYLYKTQLKYNVSISVSTNTWINRCKSVIVLNVLSNKKYVGDIIVILFPTKEVELSMYSVYKKYYKNYKLVSNNKIIKENINDQNKYMIQNQKCINKEEILKNKTTYKDIKINFLKKFLISEFYIIKCDKIISNSVKKYEGYKEAVKLLKLWCRNKKLLFTYSIYNTEKKKKKNYDKEYNFSNYSYYTDINSFILGLLCYHVCFTLNLKNSDFLQIFKETIKFLSTFDISQNLMVYKNGIHTTLKKINNNSDEKQENIFLINEIYDVFQDNYYSFYELVYESKKAHFYLNSNTINTYANYSEIFLSSLKCFPMNFEEHILFPLFVSKNYANYNQEIMYLKNLLIESLNDRIESMCIRLISFPILEIQKRKESIQYKIDQIDQTDIDMLDIFQEINISIKNRKDKEVVGNIFESSNMKKVIHGLCFFINTNNTASTFDISNVLYNPENISNFKQFWKNKAKIKRFENNTIYEIVQWKQPATNLKKKKKADEKVELTKVAKNKVFDAMFSELYPDKKTNSVHVQIIKYILKKKKYKECNNIKDLMTNNVIKYIKKNDHFMFCNKKLKKKLSFFIYFSNPLLIKDINYLYYEKIHEQYNEIKTVLYKINEKLFTISNINSSSQLLKMSDLGYKINSTIIVIDIIIDIKFNNPMIYKNAENFYKNYEITKEIIKRYFLEDENKLIKNIKKRNTYIDIYFDSTIFRLHIFFQKIVEKNLLQITNINDTKIEYVENIDRIINFIYKPIISSYIFYYSTKFYTFHTSIKICKLWLASKGVPDFDDFVENILFYIYTIEYKKHNQIQNFFRKSNIITGNRELKELSFQYNINKNQQLKNDGNNDRNNDDINDSNLNNFSFSSQIILTKFLKFITSYDWINKPLIIDYNNSITEEQKTKLINIFITKKKNNFNLNNNPSNGKKKTPKYFWISSIYDPHSVLITLPNHLFHFILSTAKNDLINIKNMYNKFEKEKWITLFLMDKRPCDIILKFNSPNNIANIFTNKNMPISLSEINEINTNEESKELTNLNKIDEINNDSMLRIQNDYNIEDINCIPEFLNKPIDILPLLNKYELIHIYEMHLNNFLKKLEEKFSSQITILYNPLCFNDQLNISNFRKKIKKKLTNLNKLNSTKYTSKSWMPFMFITFNPITIQNISLTNFIITNLNANNLVPEDTSKNNILALNNLNGFIFYVKNNASELLRSVHFPQL
ncbi:conserved Plasmodium protein, unknown function [Plasmodium berghei]|uniref:Nrap protein domain-containing protein n=2 Tax=Plasmodium berghei TaxID=5821 RepID=A0A509AKZ4_PLABA|nr:conserved Plasmodium protein, unknown function [Plasmodium berghei ANKA]CXI52961.1 conserved Plasmodium protein, unknown function [Plasmodium berghei]SCL94717.1 conserved Plasmodium protein, unknown function [Plasmodium berghei]SCM16086.1 conserved Plasmodium protein, unknown function [Plasmodium berghei]SCM17881.1 conserved Plasmodium protein, unknown function [Plasmodium berghei]SCN26203.1 conserved Plasmodium protein, unknown function [Plasmodium berghei]|eukprot:XP_034422009.1 conserved Plasmodium protein, unknown function [Plasmodium berghei ANKA]